jgi:NAD(P)-dependent dehydrogenase (short-subunit alcohol dehydrogenase family)
MSLSGMQAVVTGGTGALGGAVVEAFLGAGARVAVPFRRSGELEELRKTRGLGGGSDLSGTILD